MLDGVIVTVRGRVCFEASGEDVDWPCADRAATVIISIENSARLFILVNLYEAGKLTDPGQASLRFAHGA